MGYRGFISVIDYLSIIKVKEILLSDPVEKYQYCLKGISLQDKTINPQVIKHGIDQLRYAIPPYQIDIYRIQLIPELSEIHYIIPILVTTAPIYVLHNNLSFSDILKADNLEQVAEKKDAVIIYNEAGAQLKLFAKELFSNFRSESIVDRIMLDHKKILTEMNFKYMPETNDLFHSLCSNVSTVLVVNINSLESSIELITNSIKNFKKFIIKIPKTKLKNIFNFNKK